MTTDPNAPISPVTGFNNVPFIKTSGTDKDIVETQIYAGLTKREYFAALAMQGLLVNYVRDERYYNSPSYANVAEDAVWQADELIKKLNTPKP